MPTDPVLIRGAVQISDRTANVHPDAWDPSVFQEIPVRRAPLTQFLNLIGTEVSPSVKFHWWKRGFNAYRGDIDDVHTDLTGSNYASGGVDGSTLYLTMTAANASNIAVNDGLVIRDSDGNTRYADVFSVSIVDTGTPADVASNVGVKLRETDTGNMLAETGLTFLVAGKAMPENSELPDPKQEDVEEVDNYIQTFMEAIQITGHELIEQQRINPNFRDEQVELGLQRLMMSIERSILWGPRKTPATGSNGKRNYWTEGLISAINRHESTNILDYKNDTTTIASTSISGRPWLVGGMTFFDDTMEYLSRWTTSMALKVFCGSRAKLAITQLVRDQSDYRIENTTDEYGFQVERLTGSNVALDFIEEPLFTEDPLNRKSALVVDLDHLKLMRTSDGAVRFIPDSIDNHSGHQFVDGIKEGWMARLGLKYNNLAAMAFIKNLGEDNAN